MMKIRLSSTLFAALWGALSANANIALMNPSVNDGSFEDVGTAVTVRVAANSSTNLGAVWTYANNGPANTAGWLKSPLASFGNVTPYNDNNGFTNTVTSINLLGTGGYNTVNEGDQYAWSFEVFAVYNTGNGNLGTESFGGLSLSFDGGTTWELLAIQKDADQNSATWETSSGVYTVTAQNAADAATYGLRVQGMFADMFDPVAGANSNIRLDNISLVFLEDASELTLSPSDLLPITVIAPETVSTGTVAVAFSFGSQNNTVEISGVSVVNQQHPGAFSVVDYPPALTTPAPASEPINIRFDQTVAGLAFGQTSTGMVRVVWNEAGQTVNYTNLLPVSAAYEQVVSYSWSAQFLSDPALDVSLNGVLLEALNFSGGTNASDYDTTINGVLFQGLVSGANNNNVWVNPEGVYYSGDSARTTPNTTDNYNAVDGGIAAFDTLLSQYIWGGGSTTGGKTVTLKGLVVGDDYEVQVFFGDTSSTTADRWIVIDDGETSAFGGDGLTNHKAPTGEPGRAGLVITGTFTATKTNESFTITQYINGTPPAVAGNAFHLNAYQLRSLSAIPNPTLKIQPGTGGWLSISASNLVASATYTLQGSLNLAPANWYTVGSTSGVTEVNWLNVIAPTNSAEFFRMVAQ